MRRRGLCVLGLLLTAAMLEAATGAKILLVARDLEERPLSGFRFSYEQVKSKPTNRSGATELDLPPKQLTGQQIKIQLESGSKGAEEWFLVNSQVNIPNAGDSAAVVLMRRSRFRQIAAEVREGPRLTSPHPAELTADDRKRILVEAAARYGLTAEQLETALRSFSETQDPKDRGIAAFLEGQFSQAEELFNRAAEKKENDLIETLHYLGVSQYEQAKYAAAADTFRKAVALRGADADLLGWLGGSLYQLADWAEAEQLTRRALAIDQESFGTDHPKLPAISTTWPSCSRPRTVSPRPSR